MTSCQNRSAATLRPSTRLKKSTTHAASSRRTTRLYERAACTSAPVASSPPRSAVTSSEVVEAEMRWMTLRILWPRICFAARATISTSHSSRTCGMVLPDATRPRCRALIPAVCSDMVMDAESHGISCSESSFATNSGMTRSTRSRLTMLTARSLSARSAGRPTAGEKASADSGPGCCASSSGRNRCVCSSGVPGVGRSAGNRCDRFIR
mmetsp:Transcript_4108/g.15189  ORF Transcript_4108/g.15189 Transcript_4108/m.15189 type:complete len:209 (+) Transcript_4108:63-689(+)